MVDVDVKNSNPNNALFPLKVAYSSVIALRQLKVSKRLVVPNSELHRFGLQSGGVRVQRVLTGHDPSGSRRRAKRARCVAVSSHLFDLDAPLGVCGALMVSERIDERDAQCDVVVVTRDPYQRRRRNVRSRQDLPAGAVRVSGALQGAEIMYEDPQGEVVLRYAYTSHSRYVIGVVLERFVREGPAWDWEIIASLLLSQMSRLDSLDSVSTKGLGG